MCGALLYSQLGQPILTRILGGLLVLTAMAQLTRWSSRWHPRGLMVQCLGWVSGFFGGIAGNQGGLRAAALTAFGLTPSQFVATATATGLLVDLARAPVYAWRSGSAMVALWVPITIAIAGVLAGTLLGERVLLGLSRERFGQIVGIAIGLLGLWLLVLS